MTLISVVMPVYNAGRYLRRALDSVRQQSHNDLQIICVDDGSTDSSLGILDGIARADSRVQWFSQQNAGPGRARNAGLGEVVGDHIMFVDADDMVPPDAVQNLLTTVQATGSDFVSGRVLRITEGMAWPSVMHELALPQPRLRTHITQSTSLLYDTTPWNKLFRTDFWRANGLRFLEGVVYEDVAVMVEAHCRSRAVDVIDDVVYHWRRREDGVLSITMRRQEVLTLEHRVARLEEIRLLLRELAPRSVQLAAEQKFLRHDLGQYLAELPSCSPVFQARFVEVVATFLQQTPPSVRDKLEPGLRIAYHLIDRRDRHSLIDFLAFREEHGGRVPLRRRGFSIRFDAGPAAAALPRAVTDARRPAMRMGVDAVFWQRNRLIIEGYAFVDSIPFRHPAAAVRRLKAIDRVSGTEQFVWLAPRRYPSARVGTAVAGRYDWAGFRASIPLAQFDTLTGGETRWEVFLQSLVRGTMTGRPLGPPRSGKAWFVPVLHGPDGLVVSVNWLGERRLAIYTRRIPLSITSVAVLDGWLALQIRPNSPEIPMPDAILLNRSEDVAPLELRLDRPIGSGSDQSWPSGDLTARIPLTVLTGRRRSLPHLGYSFEAQIGARTVPLSIDLVEEYSAAVGCETLLVRDAGTGSAELVLTGPRVAIRNASWVGDQLVLRGLCTLPPGALPSLVWRNGAGDILLAEERREGTEFEAIFSLWRRPCPNGGRGLPSGYWTLQRFVDRRWQPVVSTRGRQALLETRAPASNVEIALWVDRKSQVSMRVHALPLSERGPTAQARLRASVYQPARRLPLTNTVLVECWQGKQFSDSPAALVEGRTDQRQRTVVSVTDGAVPVPEELSRVVRWGRDYYRLLGRAGMIIANDSLTTHYLKRTGQRYLQTWHGTPLKRIGFDIERIQFRNKNYLRELQAEAAKWDWLVSPNPHTTAVMRSAFNYGGEILETGYPRNDLLAEPNDRRRSERRVRTRDWLRIAEHQTAVLWAPTWRDDTSTPQGGYGAALMADLDELRAGLAGHAVILFRGHHLTTRSQAGLADEPGFFYNVSSYPDIRDLMLASDALVTDYSSIMFDYTLTDRPSLLFVPDLDHYAEVRGLYLDVMDIATGPVLTRTDDVVDAIRDLRDVGRSYSAVRNAARHRFCPWDDGHASERVWNAIAD